MSPVASPREGRIARHIRVRRKIAGTPARPRLCVFRSHRHLYAQLIDDSARKTLAVATSLDAPVRSSGTAKTKSQRAALVGKLIAQRARAKGVIQVVFDRGGYRYHGRVKALASAAREEGLVF